MYVTLDEAKTHCRVNFADDDIYISDLIEVAEMSVANEIGDDLADVEVSGVLPMPLKQGILLMIGHLYNMREPVIIGSTPSKVPLTLEYLLAPYKTWVVK